MDTMIELPQLASHPATTSDACWRMLLDRISDAAYFVDRERRIRLWNGAAETLTGYRAEDVIGSCCSDNLLVHTDEKGACLCVGCCPLAASIGDGRTRSARVFLKHHDGHRVAVHIDVIPWVTDGKIDGAVEIFRREPQEVRLSERFSELAMLPLVDVVTGVGNRQFLHASLTDAIAELPDAEASCGVVLVQFDQLGEWNDAYGEDLGDRALQVVAQTLVMVAGPYVSVSRWGGGDFIAVVGFTRAADLANIASRYQALVATAQVQVGELVLRPSISVATLLSKPQESVSQLITRIGTHLLA